MKFIDNQFDKIVEQINANIIVVNRIKEEK